MTPASPQTAAQALAQMRATLATLTPLPGKPPEDLPARGTSPPLPQAEAVALVLQALAGFTRAAAVLQAALADLAPHLQALSPQEGTSPDE